MKALNLVLLLALLPTLSWASNVGPQCNGVVTEPLAPFLFVHTLVQNDDPLNPEFMSTAPVNHSLLLRIGLVKPFFRNNAWVLIEAQESYGAPFWIGVQGPTISEWFILDPDPYNTWQQARVAARRVICSVPP